MIKQENLRIKSHIGDIITDEVGRKIIDFGSIIFTTNLGGDNFEVFNELKSQIQSKNFFSYHYYTDTRDKASKKLLDLARMEDCYFYSSGTDANEAALKIIHAQNPEKQIVLTLTGCFYGRTWGSELLNGIYNHGNFIQMPYPVSESDFMRDLVMTRIDVNRIGGIFIQSYRGIDANFVPQKYMKQVADCCKYNKIILAWDDIQAGGGRTGKLFSWENYDVQPDIATVGKFLGNGFPISAVIGKRKLFDKCRGVLSSTHSGSPLGCAASVGVLSVIEKIIENAEYEYFNERVSKLSVKSNHFGMVAALIFENEDLANRLCNRCYEKGVLLVHTGQETVKLGPALTIKKELMRKAFDIIETEIKHLCK